MKFPSTDKHCCRTARCAALVLWLGALLFFGANTVYAASEEAPLSPTTIIALIEKDTDVYYLEARLGNAGSNEFLLDTGSGYLAINEQSLSELKAMEMAEYRRSIRARLASGVVKTVPIYRIGSIDLGGGCVLHDVEAAILPGKARNIIGMNVLKMVESFSVSFSPSPRLILTGCQQPARAVAAL